MSHETTIARIRQELIEVFGKLDQDFDLPDAVRMYKSSPESWSIDEILEHITLTCHFLMLVIRKGRDMSLKRAGSKPVDSAESDLDAISIIGHPDAFPWLRPEHMAPTNAKSSEEVRGIMRQEAKECLDILSQLSGGIGTLHKVRMSVQALGKLDMYQWLYFLAQHAKRHSVEIERIKEEVTLP